MTALEVIQEGLKRVGVDFGSQKMTHYYFVEWLTTYNNLDKCAQMFHSSDRNEASLVETSCWWSNDYSA